MHDTVLLDPAVRQTLIAKIRALPGQIEAQVAGLSEEQLLGHFLPGEWNVAQNVHHLADSHMNSFIRLKLILTEEHPTLRPYDQDRWAETADATNLDIQASIALLHALHHRWAALFAGLDDTQWVRTGYHPENGPITAQDLLQSYAAHGEAHIDQIRRTLAAQSR